jgi:hypothetical protein
MAIKELARDYLAAIDRRDLLIAERVDEREKRDAAIARINELDALIATQRDAVQAAKNALVLDLTTIE